MNEVMEELQSEDPTFCHVPKCSAFIPVDADNDHGQFIRCQQCHELTCVKCKGPKDQHVKPDECPDLISKEDKELVKKKGWKQCPNKKCRKVIARSKGCPLMTCECGTAFCYKCGGMFDEDMNCKCADKSDGDDGQDGEGDAMVDDDME